MARRPSIYDSVVGVEGLPSARPRFATEANAVPGIPQVDVPGTPQNEASTSKGEPISTPGRKTPPAMAPERKDGTMRCILEKVSYAV
jgi:hypothetical protein